MKYILIFWAKWSTHSCDILRCAVCCYLRLDGGCLVRDDRWQFLKSYSIFKARQIICDIVNNKENAELLATHDRNYFPSFISGLETGSTHILSTLERWNSCSRLAHVPAFPTAFLCCFPLPRVFLGPGCTFKSTPNSWIHPRDQVRKTLEMEIQTLFLASQFCKMATTNIARPIPLFCLSLQDGANQHCPAHSIVLFVPKLCSPFQSLGSASLVAAAWIRHLSFMP